MTLPGAIRHQIEQRLAPSAAVWTECRGGLSDASVWRVDTRGASYAVRCWPAGFDRTRREWITHATSDAVRAGCGFVAAPFASTPAEPWPLEGPNGAEWEATRWISGTPLSKSAPPSDVAAAVRGLAEFHRATARSTPPSAAPRWSVARRIERLNEIASLQERTVSAAAAAAYPELVDLAARIGVASRLATAALAPHSPTAIRTQTVHGDARPEHFLMRHGRLAGLIDFGALRVDLVEADLARLGGELALGDRAALGHAIAAYRSAGAEVDLGLVVALDATNAVISAHNWLEWLATHGSLDRDPAIVGERLRSVSLRLPRAQGDL